MEKEMTMKEFLKKNPDERIDSEEKLKEAEAQAQAQYDAAKANKK